LNKLIKHLADQAGVFEYPMEGLGGYSGGNSKELDLFCKLVVHECIRSMSDSLTTQEQIDNIKAKFEIY